MASEPPQPAQTYLQLRQSILSLTPGDIGLTASAQLWGIMMETGYEVGSATLVYLSDGTVGLYFSTGGGMLGTTDNVPIAEAVKALVMEAQAHIQMTAPSETIPLPEPGQVRITLLTYNDKLTVTAKERALVDNDHPLNALYQAGHQVMNELHSMVEKGKTIHGRSHLSE